MPESDMQGNRQNCGAGPPLTKELVLEQLEFLSTEQKGGRPIITMTDDSEVGNWFLYFIPGHVHDEFLFETVSPTKVHVQIHLEEGAILGMIDFGKTKQVSQIMKRLDQLGLRSATLFRVHMQPALHRWLNVSSSKGPPLRHYRCVIHEYYAEGVRHRCDWMSFAGPRHPSMECVTTKVETNPMPEPPHEVARPVKKIKSEPEVISLEFPSVITTQMMSEFLPRRSINGEDIVVYIGGLFNMSNMTHVLTLRKARALGTYLIVGLHNEGDLNITDHVLTLSACRFVDDIVMGAPRVIDENLIRSLGINVVARNSATELHPSISCSTQIVTLRSA